MGDQNNEISMRNWLTPSLPAGVWTVVQPEIKILKVIYYSLFAVIIFLFDFLHKINCLFLFLGQDRGHGGDHQQNRLQTSPPLLNQQYCAKSRYLVLNRVIY